MIKYLQKSNFPLGIFFLAIGIWLFLAGGIYYINQFVFTGNNILFPFSVIYPSSFLVTGILFCLLFLGVGLLSYNSYRKLNFFWIYLLCVLLVFLGNMGQGNIDIAFLQPFYFKGRQYYTDAINIGDWQIWLRDFNKNLESFQMHTRTHPPYTTLIHYFFLKLFNGNVLGLSLGFFAISVLSFPLLNILMKNFDIESSRRKLMLLLFAVIPSVNIYMLVSIDGLVLTAALLFACGLSKVFVDNRLNIISIVAMFLGLTFMNLMSFSGLFLIAFAGLLCLATLYRKQFSVSIASLLSVLLTAGFIFWLSDFTGSNYLETFREASHSENPNGFMLLHNPTIYFFTRLEDVCEILFFLSLGYVAYFFSFKNEKINFFDDKKIKVFSFSAIIALAVMFLTGAYGTGETARACLYIVPFFVLFLKNIESRDISVIYFMCLLQTFGMQLIGNYYW
ncbi:hypothetical protein [Soonwooa sp.]|uniref:hypothetical protein n=1 Tax=Soonwooa sp. TaxID=1938592 RepID=UPI002603C700|nr:hypothetical protein [Soonwooa sp.]